MKKSPAVPEELLGDRYRIEHVIGNLVSNATKFSPEKSEIVIDISVEKRDRSKWEQSLVYSGSYSRNNTFFRFKWRQGDYQGDGEGQRAWNIIRGSEEALQELRSDPSRQAAEGRWLWAGADHRQTDRGVARRRNRSQVRRRTG